MSSDLTAQDQPPPTPEIPATASSDPSTTDATPELPLPPPSDSRKPEPDNIVTIPNYSRWFSWDGVHECEVRQLPEFFDGRKSPSKNLSVYKYYRNSIIKKFRANSSKKLTFTELRRTLVDDVGSIRRVFDFVDTWDRRREGFAGDEDSGGRSAFAGLIRPGGFNGEDGGDRWY